VWWETAAVVVGGLLLAWLVFLVVLLVAAPDGGSLREGARVLPDTLRLVRRLAADRTVPRSARALLWFLIGYLVLPFDLVPDFVPVIGYADDVIITSLVLRHLIHRAGADKVRQQWPGSADGLAALARVLRLDLTSG
jgi:uncharacterized membrane protein YkvA (DUF1232 family)